jgi:2,5-diketo-D-gluconate reductase A
MDGASITLNNGTKIPQFGLGVFKIPPHQTAEAVRQALADGYRHIDTAEMYGNERQVGQAIADSSLPREQIFVTTKLDNDSHGYDSAIRSLEKSLDQLGLDHVDLFLIHWPLPAKDRYVETWKAFEAAHADGRARAIGVSNFQTHHLERLRENTDTVPAVNQIELHPYLAQSELVNYHRNHGIATEAWAPLARGGSLLDDPKITTIARKCTKSSAQVVLRWHIQRGNIVFPKSATPSRIRENIDIFDFELSDEDMDVIDGMDAGSRTGPNPDAFGS